MKRKIYLASEPSYHNAKFFTETLLVIERKTSNKPVYLGLSILDLGKTVMVWLFKTKIWRKFKTLLFGYR